VPAVSERTRIGVNIYPQCCELEELLGTARLADETCDSLWIWDHLYGVAGGEQPVFEEWTTLALVASLTSQATVGSLVSSNTFRNVGLLAKAAVTVDHASRGRAVLGIGAGYQVAEHDAFGIDLGASRRERVAWLEQSLALLTELLAGKEATGATAGTTLEGAVLRPGPYRGPGRLPILLGGGSAGVVRLVGRFADGWHTRGTVEKLEGRLARLRLVLAENGRSLADVDLCYGAPVVIRDDPDEALEIYLAALRNNGQTLETAPGDPWLGSPELIASRWRPFHQLGFRHLIADIPSPHDRTTLERLAEVRAILS
jgi:alkanesulfonate monooxygenase SsuD/methylene tetrahydromethanopterin reductase-like flavin-dependent oxidoreductase (luciferase family)